MRIVREGTSVRRGRGRTAAEVRDSDGRFGFERGVVDASMVNPESWRWRVDSEFRPLEHGRGCRTVVGASDQHTGLSDGHPLPAHISTVAELSDIDQVEVDRIDPESLETLFQPTNGTASRNTGQVSFQLDAYTITVHAMGDIVVARAA